MNKKVYVVTGATSGIGKDLIIKLSENNIVFAGYRNEDKKNELLEISANIQPFYVDYAKPETIRKSTDYIKTKTTKVDTLINIAGCVVAGPLEKISVDEIRRQFNVNVFGHIEMMQGLVDILNDGKIINLSSMASYGIFPFISPYCASKRCLDMFFNTFLIENKRNIKVISIKPGVIVTPLWEKSIRENMSALQTCDGYELEMNYVSANAKKNETKGLKTSEVVDLILKVDKIKNPKLSYTVGKDALFASFVAKLPQWIVNKIVKFGIKYKIKMNK